MAKVPDTTRELTFWDHIVELSLRLRIILYAIVIATVLVAAFPMHIDFSNPLASYTFVTVFLKQIKVDLLPKSADLIAYDPLDPVWAYMEVAFILGIVISMPVIAYELYKFVNPALYVGERKFVVSFILSFTALFISGVVIAYYVVIPITFWVLWLQVFTGGITIPLISIKQFLTTVFLMLIITGFMFTIPIYFVLLVRQGLVKSDVLAKRRKIVYGGGFILAMVLTPDPTPITAAIICVPLFITIEIAIQIAKHYEKKGAKTA